VGVLTGGNIAGFKQAVLLEDMRWRTSQLLYGGQFPSYFKFLRFDDGILLLGQRCTNAAVAHTEIVSKRA
jgi:hypothetical protein